MCYLFAASSFTYLLEKQSFAVILKAVKQCNLEFKIRMMKY